MTTRRRVLAAASILAIGAGVTACGSEGIVADGRERQPERLARGATLFAARCAGCHTLDVVGAQGGATKINDRERVDGPNFNVRRETRDSVLYAIRNGGFSGAIMPENIARREGRERRRRVPGEVRRAGPQARVTPQQPAGGGNANGGATTTPTNTLEHAVETTTSTPEAGTTTNGGGNAAGLGPGQAGRSPRAAAAATR